MKLWTRLGLSYPKGHKKKKNWHPPNSLRLKNCLEEGKKDDKFVTGAHKATSQIEYTSQKNLKKSN